MPSSFAWRSSSMRAGASALRAAVHAAHGRDAQALGHPQAVHRGVAGADHDHALPERDRRVEVGEAVTAHQVDAREEFVGRIHLAGEFARDAEERRRAGAGADEHRVEAHLGHQLRHRERLADHLVRLELGAQRLEVLDLAVDDLARQPERGNAVLEHAADDVQRLEERHLAAVPQHVGRHRQARRAGADHGHLAERALEAGRCGVAPLPVVADESLQPADRHRLQLVDPRRIAPRTAIPAGTRGRRSRAAGSIR